ncbi:MAG: aminopeptidase P family protein [Patescibacteria group bacterium]
MNERIRKVSNIVKAERADALLVWNEEGRGQPATAWLSGFTGSSSTLLIIPPRRFLVTDGRYVAQSRNEARECSVFIASAARPSLRILGRLVRRYRVRRVLFDGTLTSHSAAEDVKKELPGVVFVSRKRVLQELRLVKEKGEARLLGEVAEIACKAFTRFLSLIEVGVTEKELARKLESSCMEEGAEAMAFPTIVASGKSGALPHAGVTEKKIRRGELITIDFGVRYKGYVSDMTRTIAAGDVSRRLMRIYEAVRGAQECGCKQARAGMTGEELDAVCRNYLRRKGFGRYFTHATGHGLGMEVHELPAVARGAAGEDKLPVGSVVTCEPGVYIPGVGGVRIEDTLLLTRRGSVNLTAGVSKKLLILSR